MRTICRGIRGFFWHPITAGVVLLSFLSCLQILAFAATANAHALLNGSRPANESTVKTAPDEITMSFTENISLALGGVKVFDPEGKRVRTSGAKAKDDLLTIPITLNGKGTYAVSWRVISSDGHPVRGSFLFNYGKASDGTALAKATAASSTSRSHAIGFGVMRGLYLIGLLVAVGGLVFAAWIAPGHKPRWLNESLIVVVLASAAAVVLDAAIAGGFSLSAALGTDVLREEVTTIYGRAGAIRIGLALLLLTMLRTRIPVGVVAIVGVVMAACQSLSGHAIAADPVWLRLPLDMMHVVAAGVWFGGLVQLGFAVRDSDSDIARSVRRFSAIALPSIVILVLTGLFASYISIGFSTDGLFTTRYGQLVLAKSMLLVTAMPLAYVNRSVNVPKLDSEDAFASLRKFVRAEAVIAVLIVVATAWLIESIPAKNQIAPKFVEKTVSLQNGGSLQLIIDPARQGRNKLHLYTLKKTGQQDGDVTEMTVSAELKEPAVGPLNPNPIESGPGHYSIGSLRLPFAGKWHFEVSIFRGKFDEERQSFNIEIAPTT